MQGEDLPDEPQMDIKVAQAVEAASGAAGVSQAQLKTPVIVDGDTIQDSYNFEKDTEKLKEDFMAQDDEDDNGFLSIYKK